MMWPWAETYSGPSWEEPEADRCPSPPPHPGGQAGHTHQCLHNGVVGGVHVGVQREGTLPLAVVGGVALGRDDPVLQGGERPWKV